MHGLSWMQYVAALQHALRNHDDEVPSDVEDKGKPNTLPSNVKKTASQWCVIVVTRIILNLAISMKLRIDFISKVATFEPSLVHGVKIYGKSIIFSSPGADGEAASSRCMIIASPIILNPAPMMRLRIDCIKKWAGFGFVLQPTVKVYGDSNTFAPRKWWKYSAALHGHRIDDDLDHNSDEVQGLLHRPAVMT